MTEKEKRKAAWCTGEPGGQQQEAWQTGDYGFTNIQRKEAWQADKTKNQIINKKRPDRQLSKGKQKKTRKLR